MSFLNSSEKSAKRFFKEDKGLDCVAGNKTDA